jgi:hypothetical protein
MMRSSKCPVPPATLCVLRGLDARGVLANRIAKADEFSKYCTGESTATLQPRQRYIADHVLQTGAMQAFGSVKQRLSKFKCIYRQVL